MCAEQFEIPIHNSTTAGGFHRQGATVYWLKCPSTGLFCCKGMLGVLKSTWHLKHHYQSVVEIESWGSWVFEKTEEPRMEKVRGQGADLFL